MLLLRCKRCYLVRFIIFVIEIENLFFFLIGGPDVCIDAVGFRYTKGEISLANDLNQD
jgi:hypothetical protein